MSQIATFRREGVLVVPQFFDAASLAKEIDQVMKRAFPPQRVTNYSGIHFQYVPMMTAETPVSLSLLDRTSVLAEALLDGPVMPTRAKGTRYFGDTRWHQDSESPVTSIGILAYCESLNAKNGALRVRPGSHREVTLTEHVIETSPGDLIVIDEHLFHSSLGGEVRRQWRTDFLRVPTNPDDLKNTKAYFEGIYPSDWDGGYDVDRYPSYGSDWRNSGRPCVSELEKLGVYDLAARQEAFTRSRWPLR
jgi:Phytanoyl-CoA dioxygenase (PhyH)